MYDVMAQRRERGWHKSWKRTSGLVISLCFSFSFSMQLLYFLPGMFLVGMALWEVNLLTLLSHALLREDIQHLKSHTV